MMLQYVVYMDIIGVGIVLLQHCIGGCKHHIGAISALVPLVYLHLS